MLQQLSSRPADISMLVHKKKGYLLKEQTDLFRGIEKRPRPVRLNTICLERKFVNATHYLMSLHKKTILINDEDNFFVGITFYS